MAGADPSLCLPQAPSLIKKTIAGCDWLWPVFFAQKLMKALAIPKKNVPGLAVSRADFPKLLELRPLRCVTLWLFLACWTGVHAQEESRKFCINFD